MSFMCVPRDSPWPFARSRFQTRHGGVGSVGAPPPTMGGGGAAAARRLGGGGGGAAPHKPRAAPLVKPTRGLAGSGGLAAGGGGGTESWVRRASDEKLLEVR